MNQLSNLNAKIFKQFVYNASIQTSATQIKLTINNANVNAMIDKVVFNLGAADTTFGNQLTLAINDRGHSYTGLINGFNPTNFVTISSSSTVSAGLVGMQNIVQNGQIVSVDVNTSVQDSEGVGNIYMTLTRSIGSFSTSFTGTVIYKPEITYNSKLNTRNQSSKFQLRALTQTGVGTFGLPSNVFVDQTNTIANYTQSRNNNENVTYGFNITSTNPVFYFGTPGKVNRYHIGFSSDCTPNIGIVTFSYYNGSSFVGLASTQIFNGASGPGTYNFAYDGIIIFNIPSDWTALTIPNDPYNLYNTTIVNQGANPSNEMIKNPSAFWIRCQVGFANTLSGNQTLRISKIVPLIDAEQPLTSR